MKKHFKLFLGLLLSVCFSSPAYSFIVLNNWTMDLTNVDGVGVKIENIAEFSFNGLAVTDGVDANNDGLLSDGELGTVLGYLSTSAFLDSNDEEIRGIDSDNWEMTEKFYVDVQFISSVGDNPSEFVHPATTISTGLLEWFIDGSDDGVTYSNNTTAGNWTDGIKIATWEIIPGGGGSFDSDSDALDGSDDATFKLVDVMKGVLFDDLGRDFYDLLAEGVYLPLAFTDSNFDADPDNNGQIDSVYSLFGIAAEDLNPPIIMEVKENGSATLAVVPEPSTVILLGLGILGLGAFGRKRMK